MSPLRLTGSTSGYSQLDAPAVAGDQTFTLPGTGGTLDRLNRAGNILQVVNATYSTETSRGSSTYGDTGISATITPSSSSSKILVMVTVGGCEKVTSDTALYLLLVRNSTSLIEFEKEGGYNGTTTRASFGACSTVYLDSPSTTSATTYKVQFKSSANTSNVIVCGNNSVSAIALLEVAA